MKKKKKNVEIKQIQSTLLLVNSYFLSIPFLLSRMFN